MLTRRARLSMTATAMILGVAAAATASGTAATADDAGLRPPARFVHAKLSGYQEDPQVVSTAGNGDVRVIIDEPAQQISYTLRYAAGTTAFSQAHIHFGGPRQSGGISVFLCTNAGNGPAGTQPCPAAPATLTGVITPADVLGPAAQGIAAGEFGELVAAIRAGAAYVNMHSAQYPAGEIRGQLGHHHP